MVNTCNSQTVSPDTLPNYSRTIAASRRCQPVFAGGFLDTKRYEAHKKQCISQPPVPLFQGLAERRGGCLLLEDWPHQLAFLST